MEHVVKDRPQLFTHLPAGMPPRPGYAVRPIGRKGRRRSPSATLRQPSTAALLRSEVQRLAVTLDAIGQAVQSVAGELTKSTVERRQLSEKIDRLLRANVETRRSLGLTELHIPTRHTRRQPLGSA